MSFGRFPSQWVKLNGLHAFSASLRAGRRPGEHIAALKLYLAAGAYSDFRSWTATLSLSELEAVTSLSRPMLIKGSEILRERGLIVKGLSRQTSTYRLTPADDFLPIDEGYQPTWAKVPQDIIADRLRDIPNRGLIPLASLRLYILLLTMRDNDKSTANISYRNISTYTGVRLADISKGLAILAIFDFLRVIPARYDDENGVVPARYDDENGNEYNIYMLRGDFGGKVRGRMRPRSHRPTI